MKRDLQPDRIPKLTADNAKGKPEKKLSHTFTHTHRIFVPIVTVRAFGEMLHFLPLSKVSGQAEFVGKNREGNLNLHTTFRPLMYLRTSQPVLSFQLKAFRFHACAL